MQLSRLDPENDRYYNDRAFAYENKGDYESAIKDHSEVIRRNPEDAGCYYLRAIAYESKGDYDRAIKDYDAAIRLDPEDADYYNDRATACHNADSLCVEKELTSVGN